MEKREIRLAPHNQCTGCALCGDNCPKKCISFKEENLHLFPVINKSECLACGRCVRACPVLQGSQEPDMSFKQSYACAYTKDTKTRWNSTSGGVGSVMAQYAIDNGWYICGAAFDKDFHLRHIIGNDTNCVEALRGSKYLQSDMRGVYNSVAELLRNGKTVLFFGTPCQVDALQRYTYEYRHNLITVAILCHGVNSPIVWKDYVVYLENKYKTKLLYYNFRTKEMGGWRRQLAIAMQFENGRKKKEYSYSNLFHSWFGSHYILRESCFQCPYREERRTADITIGDFWGIEQILPQLNTYNGVSVMICSTLKGSDFVSSIKELEVLEVDQQKTPKVLKGFINTTNTELINRQLVKRKVFVDYYKSHSLADVCKEYPSVSQMRHYWEAIKYHFHIK